MLTSNNPILGFAHRPLPAASTSGSVLGRRPPSTSNDLGFLPAAPTKRSKNNDGEGSDSDDDDAGLFEEEPEVKKEEIKELPFAEPKSEITPEPLAAPELKIENHVSAVAENQIE